MIDPSAASAATQEAAEALAAWLIQHQLSVAFTTYRANRLLLLGTGHDGALRLHERLFDRPMGLTLDGDCLWMAGRCQIWRFDNLLTPGHTHEGGDRLYVPAASFTTGDVNAHELVIGADGVPIFVNTAFSCLATLQRGCSFKPVWQPPFITSLAADDRCHLNGLAVQDGVPTWATACGGSDAPASWRNDRNGAGVVMHIPSNAVVAHGLAMPHSPRWHQGRLWLLNSGTGELGWIEEGRFQPLCFLPGFARGLAFVEGCAVVGLSKLRSPQFNGLPLDDRLAELNQPGGCCGLRVIDLASGSVLHSLDLPEPIDELFDVVLLPGVRQPRAIGLQGEAIDCLVKLPDRDTLTLVRPTAPSGAPHQAQAPRPFGLPQPTAATPYAEPVASAPSGPVAIRYQRVFQLTPATLAPYAALTFPSLAPDAAATARISGELLGLSAMADGAMVGLAVAERLPDGSARVLSLKVEEAWRRQGIGMGLLRHLLLFLAKEEIHRVSVRYKATALTSAALEPVLLRLGWSAPHTDFALLEGTAEVLAAAPWADRHPLSPPYRLQPWLELASAPDAGPQLQRLAQQLGAPPELLPPLEPHGIEPGVSLALLHDEALVGWVIAHRVTPTTLRYSSLFVAETHRGRARGPALLAEAFRRQQQQAIPEARAAIASANTAMLRFLRRHLAPYLSAVGASRSSERLLRPAQLGVDGF